MNKKHWIKLMSALVKVMVFILASYFIFEVVQKNFTEIKAIELKNIPTLITLTLLTFIIYTFLMMGLVFAWLVLLGFKKPESSAKIYFKSQILKYLPGNIFHFTYRHQQSKILGFGHKQLIVAAINESITLALTSLLVANLIFLWPEQITWLTSWLPMPYWPLFIIEIIGIIFAFKIIKGSRQITVYLCYLIYFLGMGWIVYLLILTLGFEPQPYLFITACFASSWLAGYVIPGAPGGTGVRESVFILLCAPKMVEYEALIIISLIRIISIFAEIIIYFMAIRLSQTYRHLSTWSDKTTP